MLNCGRIPLAGSRSSWMPPASLLPWKGRLKEMPQTRGLSCRTLQHSWTCLSAHIPCSACQDSCLMQWHQSLQSLRTSRWVLLYMTPYSASVLFNIIMASSKKWAIEAILEGLHSKVHARNCHKASNQDGIVLMDEAAIHAGSDQWLFRNGEQRPKRANWMRCACQSFQHPPFIGETSSGRWESWRIQQEREPCQAHCTSFLTWTSCLTSSLDHADCAGIHGGCQCWYPASAGLPQHATGLLDASEYCQHPAACCRCGPALTTCIWSACLSCAACQIVSYLAWRATFLLFPAASSCLRMAVHFSEASASLTALCIIC